jgi:hypothetical protein
VEARRTAGGGTPPREAGPAGPAPRQDAIAIGLSPCRHFTVTGNLRGVFPLPGGDAPRSVRPFEDALPCLPGRHGLAARLARDPVIGLRLHDPHAAGVRHAPESDGDAEAL